jgi:hypothetical protein
MIVALIMFCNVLIRKDNIWWIIIFLTMGYINSFLVFEDDSKVKNVKH